MYQIIFDFLMSYIFTGDLINDIEFTIFNKTLALSEYLSLATTIVVLFGLLFFAYWCVRALFKLTSSLFKW